MGVEGYIGLQGIRTGSWAFRVWGLRLGIWIQGLGFRLLGFSGCGLARRGSQWGLEANRVVVS